MTKTFRNLVLTSAAAGLAFAPVAAQANTRAGDSNTVYSASASAPGTARGSEGEGLSGVGAGGIIAAIVASLWATGVIFAFADDDPDQSPGT